MKTSLHRAGLLTKGGIAVKCIVKQGYSPYMHRTPVGYLIKQTLQVVSPEGEVGRTNVPLTDLIISYADAKEELRLARERFEKKEEASRKRDVQTHTNKEEFTMSNEIKQVVGTGKEKMVATRRLLDPREVNDLALITEMEAKVEPAEKETVMNVAFRDLLWGTPKNKAVVGARLIAYFLLVVPAFLAGINLGKSQP